MQARELIQRYPSFFLNDLFTHMKNPNNIIPPVRNQHNLKTCWTHVCSDALYAKMHLEYVVNPDALAVEELMEFVQLYFPADDTKVDRIGNVVFNFSGFANYCSNSFKYIMEYGLAFRSDYPLPSKEGVVRPRYDCQRPKGLKVFIDGYKTLLVHEIAAQLPNSPIAVAIEVYQSFYDWDHKVDPIYMGPTAAEVAATAAAAAAFAAGAKPPNPPPRHALLIVGHGMLNGVQYFTAKNSWGTGWGFEGYVKLARKAICKDMGGCYPFGITVDYVKPTHPPPSGKKKKWTRLPMPMPPTSASSGKQKKQKKWMRLPFP